MKTRFACCVLAFTCFIMAGCERRTLTYDYRPWCNIRVNVDWSAFGATPTGMTLMCFPQDGSAPSVITTTQTESTIAALRPGTYDIVVFNQSPDEFGTIGFRGTDRYETLEIFAREMEPKWHIGQSEQGKTAHEPERLGIDLLEGFEVTREMVETSAKRKAGSDVGQAASITLRPECVVSTATIRIRVNGIHNIRSVRGSMSGMAEGHLVAQGKKNGGKVTHLLEEWEILHDKSDYTAGEVTVAFSTFGLPDGHPATAGDADSADNRLQVSFLLVDNKTVKDFMFDVSDRIQAEEDDELTLVVEVGTSAGGNRPEDLPVEIENVKPEDGSEGGFDATVDGWGEREEIEIPI